MNVSAVFVPLVRHRFKHFDEADLQVAIEKVLTSAGLPVQREVRLSSADRIDFLVDDIGIEVKVAGGPTAVERQLGRYAASERISNLVLVTSRIRLTCLPARIGGKNLTIIPIYRGLA